jgi:hypothetical protein
MRAVALSLPNLIDFTPAALGQRGLEDLAVTRKQSIRTLTA